MPNTVPIVSLLAKNPETLRDELLGFSDDCVAAVLRFRETGDFEHFWAGMPGMVSYHLPSKAARQELTEANFTEELRLSQDLGLDSLSLMEMAFKLDELTGVRIETHEMTNIRTVGDLKGFLLAKFTAHANAAE